MILRVKMIEDTGHFELNFLKVENVVIPVAPGVDWS